MPGTQQAHHTHLPNEGKVIHEFKFQAEVLSLLLSFGLAPKMGLIVPPALQMPRMGTEGSTPRKGQPAPCAPQGTGPSRSAAAHRFPPAPRSLPAAERLPLAVEASLSKHI